MRFLSTVKHPLRFEMDGEVFEVDPEGECEIADRKSYAIKGMGLPLTEAPPPPPPALPAPPTEPKKKAPLPSK
jgi:hypothetical protein